MLTFTRAQIRALATRRARVVNRGNAHPTADLNTDSDDSYREMRDIVTECKWSTFLVTTGAQTLPTTPDANETFASVSTPAGARLIRKLESRASIASTTEWFPVEEVGIDQLRGTIEGLSRQVHTHALRWCMLDYGMAATEAKNDGTVAQGKIALSPVPSVAGQYQIWYLPEFPGTSADSGAGGFLG